MPVTCQTQRFPAGDRSDSTQKLAACLGSLNGYVWAAHDLFTSVEHQIKSLNNGITESAKLTAIPIDELSADWGKHSPTYSGDVVLSLGSLRKGQMVGLPSLPLNMYSFLEATRSSESANDIGLGDDTTVLDSAITTSQKHEQHMRNVVDSVKYLEDRFRVFKSRWDKLSVPSNRPGLVKLKHCLHGLGTQIKSMCTKLRKIVSPTIHCGNPENMVDSDVKYAPITDDKAEAEKLAYNIDPQGMDAFSNVTGALSSIITIWLDVHADLKISEGILKFAAEAAGKDPVLVDLQRDRLTYSVDRYARISSVCEKIDEALQLQIPVPAVNG
ncbi:hypothetical protein K474DRAFT_1679482 [Panus rudis PR-1116 ss-1]|nr:hypothetical protein K474DRAFT_1679482 [Panus rudis PR-1116 ss-1]